VYASGEALRALDRAIAMRRTVGGNDDAAVAADASTLRTTITNRTSALARHRDLTA
jgi:hypothetical protein